MLFTFEYFMLLFFIMTAGGVYLHLGGGWRSNRNYRIIGGLRCIAQSISYEVRIVFLFLVLVFFFKSLNLSCFYQGLRRVNLVFLIPQVFILWLIRCLAETNRRPFDFAERESELVSGFNLEYGAGGFALLFMSEYRNMIFIRALLVFIYLGKVGVRSILMCLFLIYFMVWARASFPRTRYDKLMMFCWGVVLPVAIFRSVWSLRLNCLIYVII